MRVFGVVALGLFLILLPAGIAHGADTSADSLVMTAGRTVAWNGDKSAVVELRGGVTIGVGRRQFTTDDAVVWLTPGDKGLQHVDLSLIGHVHVHESWGDVFYDRLPVSTTVGGTIKLTPAPTPQTDDTSAFYLDAVALRTDAATRPVIVPATPTTPTTPPAPTPSLPALPAIPGLPVNVPPRGVPTTGPVTSSPPPTRDVDFEFKNFDRAVTADGNLAAVCTGGVALSYRDEKQNLLEFIARDMVVFTNLKDLKGVTGGQESKKAISDHIVAAYFDGDVRVYVTPTGPAAKNELRMRAERVYYEFATDRAVMTDVVFHTVDLKKNIPIFMRADKVRQLSQGEFKAEGISLSSSAFNPPTYGLTAAHAYVREEDSGDPRVGSRVEFSTDNVLLNAFGFPFFYLPAASGTMTARGSAFREVGFENDNAFGFGLRTKWGLFESLGLIPPKDLEATYTADYFSKRGPGGGIDAVYDGGFVSDTTKQPFNFLGDLHSFFVDDRGVDVLGASRSDVRPTDTFRGRAYLEHQNFFPDNLQLQIRLGYVSDSTFMPQWFNDEYQNNLPLDESIYLNRRDGSQLLSIAAEFQPNRAVSTADETEENRTVSRLPEIKFDREGDSLLDDRLTLFGENSAAALKFDRSTDSLAQQGFYFGAEPGIPSYAYTGDPGRTVARGDAREEIDYPINAGLFKVVPYAFGRYTVYTAGVIPPAKPGLTRSILNTVNVGGDQNRLMAGAGVRVTTDFWKVDNSVESDLFDLHRLRHVVSPEVNVFASAQTIDQNRVFIFDPNVDAVNDVQAVQLALRQRWQTKRGGPGRWRSVDVFTLDVYGNFFANQPEARFRQPVDFRGQFFSSEPEASLARNSANVDAQWRVSDSTAVLADVQENLDQKKLATASVGVAIQRDARLNYFIGTRYISDLDSNIATVEANYELDKKYTLTATESFDFAQSKDVYYTFALIRKFDNFSASVRVYYDQDTSQKGFSFSLQPYGLARGIGSNQLAPQQ